MITQGVTPTLAVLTTAMFRIPAMSYGSTSVPVTLDGRMVHRLKAKFLLILVLGLMAARLDVTHGCRNLTFRSLKRTP